jgi:hypothetical protein
MKKTIKLEISFSLCYLPPGPCLPVTSNLVLHGLGLQQNKTRYTTPGPSATDLKNNNSIATHTLFSCFGNKSTFRLRQNIYFVFGAVQGQGSIQNTSIASSSIIILLLLIIIMGNALSEEEQEQILEEAYNLEDPEADKYLNSGTAAPSCQPKHTQKELLNDSLMAQQQQLEDGANGGGGGGASANNHGDGGSSEDGMDANNPNNNNNSSSSKMMSAKHRRESSLGEGNNSNSNNSSTNDQEERRKRQHTLQQQQQLQEQEMAAAALQQKKLSYFQMARLGYQELVNAIIRPPRADYKVRLCDPSFFVCWEGNLCCLFCCTLYVVEDDIALYCSPSS